MLPNGFSRSFDEDGFGNVGTFNIARENSTRIRDVVFRQFRQIRRARPETEEIAFKQNLHFEPHLPVLLVDVLL